jgi:hypothetical protein
MADNSCHTWTSWQEDGGVGAYTVMERWRPRRVGLLVVNLLVLAAGIAWAVRVVHVPDWFLVALLGMAAWTIYVRTRPRPMLRVDAGGVQLISQDRPLPWYVPSSQIQRRVPWPSIWQVVVMAPPPAAMTGDGLVGAEVALRLRQGAPLPANVRGLIHDPARADAIAPALRLALGPEPLDRERLAAAVAAFGPPDVRVVDEPLAGDGSRGW